MSWQINGKFILVPKNQTPSPTGTPTPTPSITDTPTPTPTITNTPSPTPNEFGIITENGVYIISDENGNTLIPE
jgi:hypothetical protein